MECEACNYESIEDILSYSDSRLESEFGENIAHILCGYRVELDEFM